MSIAQKIVPSLDTLHSDVEYPNEEASLFLTKEELDAQLSSPEAKVDTINKVLIEIEHFDDLDKYIHDEDGYLSTWMDGDRDFSMFTESAPVLTDTKPFTTRVNVDSQQSQQQQQTTTTLLINEYENFNWPNNGAFTPPQSPPYSDQKPLLLLATLEPTTYTNNNNVVSTNDDHSYPAVDYKMFSDLAPPTPQPDVAKELAVVDELVRTRVESLAVPSSPSSSSSASSNFGDSSSSEDPEWTEQSSPVGKVTATKTRKRAKPYGGEDRRCRKKEQNKNAATRYRMKKKAEVDLLQNEENDMITKNVKLEANIKDLQREINCIKGLMRDMFKAKGLIN